MQNRLHNIDNVQAAAFILPVGKEKFSHKTVKFNKLPSPE